jgi:hypothetical protein
LNFKSRLEFFETSQASLDVLAEAITHRRRSSYLYQHSLKALPFNTIQPPHNLTIFNGSPRGWTAATRSSC